MGATYKITYMSLLIILDHEAWYLRVETLAKLPIEKIYELFNLHFHEY